MSQNSAMPQSLARVLIHTVFSTKNREPVFQDAVFRAEVHAYLGGCAKELDCLPLQVGGVSNHVHLLTTLSRSLAIGELVKEIKRVSTNWIHKRGGLYLQFHRQAGYGFCSVSESRVDAVVRFIADQGSIIGRSPFKTSTGSCCGAMDRAGMRRKCGIEG